MNNFNWNNYIGEHMSEPLQVERTPKDGVFLRPPKVKNIDLDVLSFSDIYLAQTLDTYSYKPLIKSISDLPDEELCSVVQFPIDEILVKRKDTEMFICALIEDDEPELICWYQESIGIRFYTDYIDPQGALNKLYSLHVSLDYEELIKNNQAVKKELI